MSRKGLVLSGGGARGAYQIGALKAIVEITSDMGVQNPFSVFTGSSVGSINTAYLAANAGNFKGAVRRLGQMWGGLESNEVYDTDLRAILKIGSGLMLDILTGGLLGRHRNNHLLNTTPLRQLIARWLPIGNLEENIKKGTLHGIAVKALDYSTGMNTTFFQGHSSILPWMRAQCLAERTHITVDHVMASAAIPIVFPPVKVGDRYYGDGSVRNYTPLSPAIKMGAKRLLVISAKRQNIASESPHLDDPSIARIASILLNSLLLDNIDIDVERLTRINHTIQYLSPESKSTLKPVQICLLQPSQDLSKVAMEYTKYLPRVTRFLLQGWGSKKDASDVISNLLFEGPYIQRIIELGYDDTMQRRHDIEVFFQEENLSLPASSFHSHSSSTV